MNPNLASAMITNLGWTLLHFVWQGAAVAVIVALLFRCFRNSPNFRYACAGFGMTFFVIMPTATFLRQTGQMDSSVTSTVSTAPTLTDPRNSTIPEAMPNLSSTSLPALASLLPWMVAVWLGGVILFSLRLIYSFVVLRKTLRSHTSAAPDWVQQSVERLQRLMCITRQSQVYICTRHAVPATAGILKPVILLPASLITGITPAQLELILAHELAHVRRHDYLVNILQSIVEIVLFYHPGVWYVSRLMRTERENCCDDAALMACSSSGEQLARALLSVEVLRSAGSRLLLAASGGQLLQRVKRLVGTPAEIQPARSMAGVLAATLLVATMVVLANRGTAEPERLPGGHEVDSDPAITTQLAAESPVIGPDESPAGILNETLEAHPFEVPVNVRQIATGAPGFEERVLEPAGVPGGVPGVAAEKAESVLRTRSFSLMPTYAIEGKLKDARTFGENAVTVLKSILYDGTSEDAAAKEGRKIQYDPTTFMLKLTDRPEKLNQASTYLKSLPIAGESEPIADSEPFALPGRFRAAMDPALRRKQMSNPNTLLESRIEEAVTSSTQIANQVTGDILQHLVDPVMQDVVTSALAGVRIGKHDSSNAFEFSVPVKDRIDAEVSRAVERARASSGERRARIEKDHAAIIKERSSQMGLGSSPGSDNNNAPAVQINGESDLMATSAEGNVRVKSKTSPFAMMREGDSVTTGNDMLILSPRLKGAGTTGTPFSLTVAPEDGELIYEFDENRKVKKIVARKGASLKMGGVEVLGDQLVIDPESGQVKASGGTSEPATLRSASKIYGKDRGIPRLPF